jgi:hypothetical protein
MNNNIQQQNFFELKSHEFKDLYYLYLDLCAAKASRSEIEKSLSDSMKASLKFPEFVSLKVANILIENFSSPSFATIFCDLNTKPNKNTLSFKEESSEEEAVRAKYFITTLDYERFNQMTSVDPHVNASIKHLLLALMSVYRRYFHRSGWIKYDRKVIFYLAGLQELPTKESEELMNYLHQEYGFEMQVVGSNSPIPCFKFAWMLDQPQPGSHLNPFLDFGELSPKTIAEISSGLINPKTME